MILAVAPPRQPAKELRASMRVGRTRTSAGEVENPRTSSRTGLCHLNEESPSYDYSSGGVCLCITESVRPRTVRHSRQPVHLVLPSQFSFPCKKPP